MKNIWKVDGNRYETRFVAAAERGRQMRISLETRNVQIGRFAAHDTSMVELLRSPISVAQAAETHVVVNLFDGGPRSSVSLAIDSAAPVEMTKVIRPDPFVVQLYRRHHETIKEWVKPQNCSHLWSAALPAGLKRGTYALTVTAADEYGRSHLDRMVLEIAAQDDGPVHSSAGL